MALKRLISDGAPVEVCYFNRWTAPLGLVVFLVALLAWIGFEMTLHAGLLAVAAIPPLLGIALDSALRLLPAMIAIGLLFRRPSHAVRVLGRVRRPSWVRVFGMFSLLSWLSQGTTLLFGGMSPRTDIRVCPEIQALGDVGRFVSRRFHLVIFPQRSRRFSRRAFESSRLRSCSHTPTKAKHTRFRTAPSRASCGFGTRFGIFLTSWPFC